MKIVGITDKTGTSRGDSIVDTTVLCWSRSHWRWCWDEESPVRGCQRREPSDPEPSHFISV